MVTNTQSALFLRYPASKSIRANGNFRHFWSQEQHASVHI